MLTLRAVFNILYFLDVSSVLAEIPAACKIPGGGLQSPSKMALESSVGAQKSWGFKAPPWLAGCGPKAPFNPPLSITFEFTLFGLCLVPVIPFNGWVGFPVKAPFFSGETGLRDLRWLSGCKVVSKSGWESRIPDWALCSGRQAQVTLCVTSAAWGSFGDLYHYTLPKPRMLRDHKVNHLKFTPEAVHPLFK